MASITNAALADQISEVKDDVAAVKKDVAELKAWLEPLRNGAGAKVSKITTLVDLAVHGQEAQSRRQTLNDAAEIIFGWIPRGWRRLGGALAMTFAFFGGLSSVVIVGEFIWQHWPH